ncbi:MAG: InlB B-repeat-containing protein, partial [Treponema sp.]|nr:InlB B-repeat-containing protein [Treponema sp.]
MKHKTLFLFISIISLAFLSCSEDTESSADAASYTVTFAEEGGLIPSQTVKEGECVEKPLLTPSKTGYTFTGWYYTDS